MDVPGNDPIQLRYMLASVHSALDEPDPGPMIIGVDDDELDALVDAWTVEFAQILSDGLGGLWEISVGDPVAPTDAGGAGIDLLNRHLLILGVDEVAGPDIDPGSVSVRIVGCRTHNGDLLTIGLEGEQGRTSGTWWLCNRDRLEDIDAACACLDSLGVTRIVVADQIYRGEPRCEECGEPLFPAVSGEGFRHA